MRWHSRLVVCTLACIAAVAGVVLRGQTPPPQASGSGTLAIVGATLIDGQGGAPVRDAVVVVRDGKFVAAGPRATVTVPAGAEVIAAAGKYVIPGLIDGHVHYRTYL